MYPRGAFISLVAPLDNDGAIVRPFVEELAQVLESFASSYEIILVDDFSHDDTVDQVEELLACQPHLRLIRLSRRFGADIAIAAGLHSAIGDCVVVMLPNCDPVEAVPDLVELVDSGHGVVTGTARRLPGEGRLHRWLRSWFFWYCRQILHLSIPEHATRFQAFSRKAVTAITRIHANTVQFPAVASTVGYDSTTFPYQQICRTMKAARRPLLYYLQRAAAITVSNSVHPLRFVSYLGGMAGLLNLVYVFYVLLVNLIKEQVAEGWTTISLQVSAMFFFVFLILIVVCEYLGYVLEETKDRPLYHVLEERNGSLVRSFSERRNVV
jgi:glycosyltransferase involved in cell wall biosynthesis